jgi:hypothetical protein
MGGLFKVNGGGGLKLNATEGTAALKIAANAGDVIYEKNGTQSRTYMADCDLLFVPIQNGAAGATVKAYILQRNNTLLLISFDGGVAKDETGYCELTPTGTVTYPAGKYGTGAAIGAISSRIYISNPNERLSLTKLNAFTIEWWEKRSGGGITNGALFDCSVINNYEQRLLCGNWGTDGSYWFIMGGSAHTHLSTGAVPSNQWVHFAMTKEGTTYKVYRDGVLKGSVTYAAVYTPTAIQLFNHWNLDRGDTNVIIDDFRISNIVRYAADFTPPSTPHTLDVI